MVSNAHRFFSSLAIVALLGFCSVAVAEDTLKDLIEVERKVQATVSKVMPTVVAVTDGQGFGSGVIVSEDGLVLTAGHVMASPIKSRYEVFFPDGSVKKAIPLGKNLNVDAGMVKIVDPGPYPFVDIAKAQPELGDWVVTLGHSGGYDLGRKPPVRTGRVLGRRNHQLITDAVLIGGDSGGPLFNLDGQVVGIHSSIGDSIAENRHVTVETFRKYWSRMEAGESWGELPELSPKKRDRKNLAGRPRMGVIVDRSASNALIKEVAPEGAAEKAGIRAGDVVTRFDGKAVANADELINEIRSKRPGTRYIVELLRNGYFFKVELVLDQF